MLRVELVALSLLAVSLVLSACDAESIEKTSDDCSVVLYGDSILHGAYVGDGQTRRHRRNPAAELKARRPAWRIDDRTQPGQSLEMLAKTFHSDQRASRVVVLGSGIAEGWSGGSVLSDLPRMIETVRREGRTPVLTGYSRQLPNAFMTADKLEGRDRVDAEVKALALETRIEFADFGAARPAEMADEVHPTEQYSLRLSAKLIEALDRVAPECSR